MPKQKHRYPPTPWHLARPVLEAELAATLASRGFVGAPGVLLWRARGEFVDMLHLRSKYGTACQVVFGCDLFTPGAALNAWNFFNKTLAQFEIPTDPARHAT